MKTKLVYVLTSEPDKNYCEQALLSIYTARYHNPNAYIVLIVDDFTDQLLTGKRAEILEYISEKLVVQISEIMSTMQRSRWLKTSVRNLVNGDLLFIDCDTLITGPIDEVDTFQFDFGAVLDSHLSLTKGNATIYQNVLKNSIILEWDITKGDDYFNSGVMYVKDTVQNKLFFYKWHSYWFDGMKKGVSVDQPSFAKVNIELDYPVQILEGVWNCLVYTQVEFIKAAKILHFWSFRNMSYVFANSFLDKVKIEGVKESEFIKDSILKPAMTYIPFDNIVFNYSFSEYIQMFINVKRTTKLLQLHLDEPYTDFLSSSGIYGYIGKMFEKKFFILGALVLVLYKFYTVRINKNYKFRTNTCSN